MRFIWATRGRDWGFTFLRDGGLTDPLPTYEEAFAGTNPTLTTLRFNDPESRTDRAGRVIEHDFVFLDPTENPTAEDVWQLVADEFARKY
ncbi:hypothetical protein [Corynebacterium sp. CCUG 70398]|uniref:hypothetical protein n=1 Tax=Corynebacterium sp. CCUG 70398 TaxID=2823891 RepID=UPI00210EFC11|nr:hypothetical protein [Corynebacterium sp. CCUG 70398]MCQ4623755.1 hypothetical protein [Corynebacterium sp. CCUG 70398]